MSSEMSSGKSAATPLPLAREAADVPAVFAERFNSGQPQAVAEMYEAGAVFVSPDGTVADSPESIARANASFLALGLPITVRPRQVYAAGDTALLIVDWVIDGTAPDGRPTHIEGTATDVARRGADGVWRYVIDRPAG
ncbi:YybH family protein [Streptomyces sp. NPDC053499]|uniref:YybH family protein n=1 Tax=Streptomyces sp. NPDC053499 TaxID=3365707 RepID=UPI0037D79F4B